MTTKNWVSISVLVKVLINYICLLKWLLNIKVPFQYYSYDESTNITQSEMIIKLRTSLSKTLTHFYPLVGSLSENHNTVDCFDYGVQFLLAQVELESNLLDIIRRPIIEELNQLVKVEPSNVEEQITIQLN